MSAPLVTLLSDFGSSDGYVGAMKGALLSSCPDARLIDLSHQIEPGEIASGAFVLAQAAPCFPEGSVHLAVVDPGVGSKRRAIVCQIDARLYVAPDNGLLDTVIRGGRLERAYLLSNPKLWRPPISAVFHGRDIFAPVAGFLAAGGRLEETGEPIDPRTLVRLPAPGPRADGDAMVGRVAHVDRFGNLLTDLWVEGQDAADLVAEVEGCTVEARRTYSDVPEGELVALVGSAGYLEVSCNCDSAARRLGARVGSVVVLSSRPGVQLA